MALFNDNIFSLTTDVYHDLLESYDYNLNITKAIHNHDINDITLTESYNKQEILREGIGDVFKTIKDKIIHLWNIVKDFFKRLFGINKIKAKNNNDFIEKAKKEVKEMKEDQNSNTSKKEPEKPILQHTPKKEPDLTNEYEMYDYSVTLSYKEAPKLLRCDTSYAGVRMETLQNEKNMYMFARSSKEFQKTASMYVSNMREHILSGRREVNSSISSGEFLEKLKNKLRRSDENGNKFKKIINFDEILKIPELLEEAEELREDMQELKNDAEDIIKSSLRIIEKFENQESFEYNKDDIIYGCTVYSQFLQELIIMNLNILTTWNNMYDEAFREYVKLYEKGKILYRRNLI